MLCPPEEPASPGNIEQEPSVRTLSLCLSLSVSLSLSLFHTSMYTQSESEMCAEGGENGVRETSVMLSAPWRAPHFPVLSGGMHFIAILSLSSTFKTHHVIFNM